MEASKSKFVYPDKLYARCKDNKTLDMSYVPQNMEAVEYTRTDSFIERVESFLNKKDDRDYYTIGYIKRHLQEIIKEVGL